MASLRGSAEAPEIPVCRLADYEDTARAAAPGGYEIVAYRVMQAFVQDHRYAPVDIDTLIAEAREFVA